ncbi:hypothetical protein NF27_DP00860 [Candidatus Jidaibacter acanthamoeba]|uniref:Uncharacterized protein n=1 Tax=Candidatus Jidaibacter acanthamoebae TaxID=86105 RepID=A0A0C1MTW9_9RICK|nr:hypothetical protein [Candidatus Jidaibacter acanthamoeba]KIE05542.1 hypothetical protein NF27_DP00860 [Candidatus Jidaibacter acanthamoeba]
MDSISKINYAKMVDELNQKISSGEVKIEKPLYESMGTANEASEVEVSGNELDFSASIAKGAMLHELISKVASGEAQYIDFESSESVNEFVSKSSDFEVA